MSRPAAKGTSKAKEKKPPVEAPSDDENDADASVLTKQEAAQLIKAMLESVKVQCEKNLFSVMPERYCFIDALDNIKENVSLSINVDCEAFRKANAKK